MSGARWCPANRERRSDLLPKREVLRRTRLAKATLNALIQSGVFPASVLPGRWDPEAVDAWNRDARGDEHIA